MLKQILSFLFYVLIQVILVRNLVLFDIAFCFVYIGFLLLLPLETSIIILLMLGFFTGIVIDIFYDSLGMHTAACVLLAYLRTYLVNLLTPGGGYESGAKPSVTFMGLRWFSSYALTLIFVHHFILFFAEIGGFNLFFFTLSKVVLSTAFSFLLVVVIQYLSSTTSMRKI